MWKPAMEYGGSTHVFQPVHVLDVEGDVKERQESVKELELQLDDNLIITAPRLIARTYI